MIAALLIALAGALPLASGHASIWHSSMYGFNVTDKTFDYDNRPVAPLTNYSFEKWWFHGHLDYPPNPGDFFELPAGKPATTEIACNKGATTWFNSSEGGDIRQGDNVCPNSDPSEYHTTGPSDLKGCALAIAYESDVTKIQPEDFTVFSVNQTCVWTRFTDFQVPERMPPCPPGGCHCAWFWIHSQDSGGEQNYMTGFKCNVTGSTSNVPLAKPQVARRCGADPDNGKPNAAPGNCTYGAKQPLYWFQAERNNMFEGTYSPPFYLDLYNFKDGAQDDIFVDSYPNGLPAPSPNSTFVPTPFLGNGIAQATSGVGGNTSEAASSSSISSTFSSATTSVASTSAIASTASIASSGTANASPTSATLSASTLSQTASFSTSISSSLSPDLPISTASASLPSASATTSTVSTFSTSFVTTNAPAESVAVTTSTVISTLVVTVTAQPSSGSTTAALSSSSDAASSAFQGSIATSAQASSVVASATVSSSVAISSSSIATVASSTTSSSAGFATAGASTIFLNGPSSSTGLQSSAQTSTSASSSTQSASNTATPSGAPTTIDLNFAVDTNQSSSSVKDAVRPAVLAAAPTNAMCKRQFRRKVALRRRTEPSVSAPTQAMPEAEEEHALLSRINLPGLRRHRKLLQRSSLWHLF